VVGIAGTEDLGSGCLPGTKARDKIDGAPCLRVVQKSKNSNILVLAELGAEVFARRRMNYRLEKKTQEFTFLFGTFLVFFGNDKQRKLRLLPNTPPPRRSRRITGVVFYFLRDLLLDRIQPSTQGEVFWNFWPESEPICFATRNSQSCFSAIPSLGGSSGEDGAYARLHGCTEWLADGMSRALPTHPHVHIVVDALSIGSSG
jgi:hypothetical protein